MHCLWRRVLLFISKELSPQIHWILGVNELYMAERFDRGLKTQFKPFVTLTLSVLHVATCPCLCSRPFNIDYFDAHVFRNPCTTCFTFCPSLAALYRFTWGRLLILHENSHENIKVLHHTVKSTAV